ncbi:hypothetical protein AK972_5999 [Pseudomonas yamanorum]|nr:hypothetical protein AK972_5999 [Pseudomonas yamanorum]
MVAGKLQGLHWIRQQSVHGDDRSVIAHSPRPVSLKLSGSKVCA